MSKLIKFLTNKISLPECIDSEIAILSMLVTNNEIMKHLMEYDIDDECFHSPIAQNTFKACKDVLDEGYNLDPKAVFARLKGKHSEESLRVFAKRIVEESYIETVDLKWNIDQLLLYQERRRIILDSINHAEDSFNGVFLKDQQSKNSMKSRIEKYLIGVTGNFSTIDIDIELGLRTPKEKDNRKKAIRELIEDKVIERVGEKAGVYRVVDKEENIIHWQNADLDKVYNLKLPMGIHDMVNIYPKNIIVFAGVPNAGKTAFLLNVLRDNMSNHNVFYFSSEMGSQEFKVRLSKFKEIQIEDWKFTPIERGSDFADVIRPDDLNIIDFFEVSDNFYRIGADLKKLHDRLENGIAIIAIQKKKGAEFGRGAEFALEKPRLYITIDPGELKIVKAKNWKNPEQNPCKVFDFKLIQGCEFIQTNIIKSPMDWYKENH